MQILALFYDSHAVPACSGLSTKDGKSYDLTGKQVNDPEPGTIYIQDGEKRIAR